LVTMATAAILNLFNPQQLPHKGWFFQNGCRCNGNGQNAKKMKNTKRIIAGYSPNRNWLNLIGTTSTSNGTR
jgi:hypothetical protein